MTFSNGGKRAGAGVGPGAGSAGGVGVGLSSSSGGSRDELSVAFDAAHRKSPYGSTGYENFIQEAGGLYVSLPRNVDDDDGNTTTSGSYTIESDNLNDSMISA